MRRRRIYRIVFGVIFVTSLAGASFLFLVAKNESFKIRVFRHPLVQYTLPTYRSLRKIADLPYVWYKVFGSDLPKYAIMLGAEDVALMNAALPKDNFKGRLTDENKVKVRADFFSVDYGERIRIRYRGRGPNHWNAFKKSYHMDFPDENPFNGYTALKFVIPEDRSYAIEHLNAYRAQKLGMFVPEPWFGTLEISEQDMGVYTVIPHWSTSLIEQNGFSDASNIFGVIDFELKDLKGRDFFAEDQLSFWEDYTRTADTHTEDFDSLREFLSFLNSPDAVYEKTLPAFVDMDALYGWLIMNTLASSSHQNATVNIILLRDASTGKFHPVPWDIQIYRPQQLSLEFHPLIGRTLGIQKYREEFLRRLETYVLDQSNYDGDMAFYDDLTEQIHTEIMKDDAKAPLNFQTNQALKKIRTHLQQNYMLVEDTLKENGEELFTGEYTSNQKPAKLSTIYTNAGQTINEFILHNPGFYKIDETTVGIGPGTQTINKTTVLPTDTTLTIQPGTTLLLGKDVSIVSWKNVMAKGSLARPIKLLSVGNEAWGSILVLGDQSKTSEFNYVTAENGSGFHDSNITATGMIAIHRSNGIIQNSTFRSSKDDDALNIKFGNVEISNNIFRNVSSDAIDVDGGTGTISDNTFDVVGGDAIDLSHSTIHIENNTISSCADKGISVGEKSNPTIDQNSITDCAIGISSKDLSQAVITNTSFTSNEIAIEVKQKKPIFGGGHATVTNSTFIGNGTNFVTLDEGSSIEENSNTFEN